ncbi:unnamed protein product [Rotaria socialis]|uniref:Uncharacterized protein n=2 Tax=Rotaria socialis TaxID=392032 RepID=A0A818AKW6_9BILA|nr:unnamed protein product [Rotaria socialis]
MILHTVISLPQINLHLTDSIEETDSDHALQHNCLYVTIPTKNTNDSRQIMFYCLSEWPSKWNIQKNNRDRMFTFEMLYQQGITSWELYTWSAPMDVVERYEYYIQHVKISNITSMAAHLFYNCTGPRFGPMCQYSFNDYEPYHSTLTEIVDYSFMQRSELTTLTCYIHLQCNRGAIMACLDWSEICDGKIDCIDGGRDEENCWQLEINECGNDEYRCLNGQCIPKRFFHDDPSTPDCLDRTDELNSPHILAEKCITAQPTFTCEDGVCPTDNTGIAKPFLNFCSKNRLPLILEAILLEKPNTVKDICWSTFLCALHVKNIFSPECFKCRHHGTCKKIIEASCPGLMLIPNSPIFFGNIYFAYTNNESKEMMYETQPPQYICYREPIFQEYFANTSSVPFNNLTCHHHDQFKIDYFLGIGSWKDLVFETAFEYFWPYNPTAITDSVLCNKPNMYQCLNSTKCISKDRLNDKIIDCYYADDEGSGLVNNTCLNAKYFKCEATKKCISNRFVEDGMCDCPFYDKSICVDESLDIDISQRHISFQTICDGFTELLPITIDGANETDETNCEGYPCNNTYTRCNGIWNCYNGADEVDCDSSPLIQCSRHHHICVLPDTNQLTCLPITRANDGKVDCLGGTDEPKLCRSYHTDHVQDKFYCRNDTENICIRSILLCDSLTQCRLREDEQFCYHKPIILLPDAPNLDEFKPLNSDAQDFFRKHFSNTPKRHIVHFSLGKQQKSTTTIKQDDQMISITSSATDRTFVKREQRCHRGIELTVWLDDEKNLTTSTCLCPPSFYGDRCQYQNQRVSLTLTFAAFPDSWRIPFLFLIMLIDNTHERTIHTYEQLTYLPVHDCRIKYGIYLLYSIRPKELEPTQYSIHIDIFEKISLKYRGSWLVPLNYSFLPVHRIATELTIPREKNDLDTCLDKNCIHGGCVTYANSLAGKSFCRCHQGWSGWYCTIPYDCTCSSDSLCIGKAANKRPVCICPIEKFGSRCLLGNVAHDIDQNSPCQNGGQYIPSNGNNALERKFICVCRKGFTGNQCERVGSKIIITFHKDIVLPESMLVHFIEVIENEQPNIATTFATIPIWARTTSLLWSRPFHIVFVELSKKYYLSIIQTAYNRSMTHIKTIEPSDRCVHISELFHQTVVRSHMLRRIKLYHVPCQNRSTHLSCFYDEAHLCICDSFGDQRLANCFEFNHQMKLDCFGQNSCQNGAECFQDNRICPQASMCVCPRCFYGARCQFSTHGFSLSLDAILSYHIRPGTSILNQPTAVQVSIVVSTAMILIGSINGILSLITFRNQTILKFSSGFYLLCSSITTLITVIIWTLKFWILIAIQTGLISNQSFLYVQCVLIDFFLQIGLNMNQWFNACIATDRAIITMKGINFDQKKSKKMAKYIIIGLFIFTIMTSIHDPIHRRLIDDENDYEKRIWCTLAYSRGLKKFDLIMNIFHFIIPFIMNFVSALLIIIITTKKRINARTDLSYEQTLYQQFLQHYNLLVAPCVLVLIAIPRAILSFVSGCMNTPREYWLFLIGYFISFIPLLLGFILFVLPSKIYKEEFRKTVTRYGKFLQSYRNRLFH